MLQMNESIKTYLAAPNVGERVDTVSGGRDANPIEARTEEESISN